MKKEEKILQELGEIDPAFVAQADPARPALHKPYTRWLVIAACLVLLSVAVTVGVMIAKRGNADEPPPYAPPQTDNDRPLWVDNRERNGKTHMTESSAIVWRWEYRDLTERYTSLQFQGREYGIRYCLSNTAPTLSSAYLTEKLGDTVAKGYDMYEEKEHTVPCSVYGIAGLDSAEFLAVRFEDAEGYYVYKCHEYDPPSTLGEMLTRYRLSEYVSLPSFYYAKDNEQEGHYAFSDGAAEEIWRLLEKHADTPFASDYTYYGNKEHVSFSLHSTQLGIENLSLTVNSEGYVFTNLADFGYYFQIGEEAAMEIISYAMANKGDTPAPTRAYLVGQVTEITDTYFKLDDSVMMKDPSQGIVFTVSTESVRIRRYFDMGIVKVGSTVFVTYDGKIYADDPTKIENPLSLDKCFISENGEDILIPE